MRQQLCENKVKVMEAWHERFCDMTVWVIFFEHLVFFDKRGV